MLLRDGRKDQNPEPVLEELETPRIFVVEHLLWLDCALVMAEKYTDTVSEHKQSLTATARSGESTFGKLFGIISWHFGGLYILNCH